MSLAAWLQEAWETGNPLAPIPPGTTREAAEDAAAALAEGLGAPVVGLRMARGPGGAWVAAPLPETRLLRAGTPVSVAALRAPRLSVGVMGVLAAPLGEGAPAFSALHPVLDVAATRFRDGPASAEECLADLGGVGFVLVGKRAPGTALPEAAEARLGPTGARPRPIHEQLGVLFAQAAAEARRGGGLPAGALLLVAGLGGEAAPKPGEKWSAAVAGVGRISVGFG
ncbi:hypothetical protein ACI6QG_09070 [Roseococcus sp. DSY-14]|uniref:hypothetical protein n=1 Tax=Roseococcus sp. DSY-14 TaxID=3369650 RepID=UPI00387B78A8